MFKHTIGRLIGSKGNPPFAVLIFIAVVSILLSLLSNSDGANSDWFSGLFQNLGSGIVGALVTYYLFDRIMQRRSDKERLIRELGSSDNATAVNAARELSANGWLTDGSLQRTNFMQANLQGAFLTLANFRNACLVAAHLERANLGRANLRGVSLEGATMEGADLAGANLEDAYLADANMRSARLYGANLRDANLTKANLHAAWLGYSDLRNANLLGVDLQSANLTEANLEHANLEDAQFHRRTILPNDKEWTPDTDLARFTDPNHPNFWRSDDPRSPAYRAPSD